MVTRLVLVFLSVVALGATAWMIVGDQFSEGTEDFFSKIEQIMNEEAAKDRFAGPLGDFVVFPLSAQGSDELRIFGCAGGGAATAPIDRVETTLRAHELWSPAFDVPEGVGWSCPGEGVVAVNNQGMHGVTSDGDAVGRLRGYVRSVPVPVMRDAPKDRLELVTVEGHPGLLERPIEGYPYGRASLMVIERYPNADTPGIVVVVERARSAEQAIKIAEEIMP